MNQNDIENPERWVNDLLAARIPDWEPNTARGFAEFTKETRASRLHRRAWMWAMAGLLSTSVAMAALPATRAFAERCVWACRTESVRVRDFFAGGASDSAPKNIFATPGHRESAADFRLADASGQLVRLSDFRGKVVLLNFWATWCVPCGAEVPLLVDFQQQYHDRGFEVLGVSLDEDGWKSVKPYIESRHVNYRVMIGNGDVTRAYGGLESVPMTLIIDKSGRIAATHRGLCRKGEYEADIQAVLNE